MTRERTIVAALSLLAVVVVSRPLARAADELPLTPLLKSKLIWQEGNGAQLAWDKWPEEKKRRLAELYEKIKKGDKDLGLALGSPENNVSKANVTFYTEKQAFDLFAAQVAHCLHVDEAKLVPWKLEDFGAVELDALLDSTRYYSRIKPSKDTEYPAGIKPGRDYMETPENHALGALESDPRIAFDFVTGKTSKTGKSLVGKDPLETLANMTVWMRDNLAHGEIPASKNPRQPWLEQRLHPGSGKPFAISNEGCHSASKLFVDLARSINIPLLHVRTQESDVTTAHFFNRSHGGLIYGWGHPHPRVLSHTDNIYADSGEPTFPIDEAKKLLGEAEAARLYFERRWTTPEELTKAGFVYRLERVVPDKGFGVGSRGDYEDRTDYGFMAGYWKTKGASALHMLMREEQQCDLGGDSLLRLAAINPRTLQSNLTTVRKRYQGDFEESELPHLHTIEENVARAQAVLEALGGVEAYKKALEDWKNKRGAGLMK